MIEQINVKNVLPQPNPNQQVKNLFEINSLI